MLTIRGIRLHFSEIMGGSGAGTLFLCCFSLFFPPSPVAILVPHRQSPSARAILGGGAGQPCHVEGMAWAPGIASAQACAGATSRSWNADGAYDIVLGAAVVGT